MVLSEVSAYSVRTHTYMQDQKSISVKFRNSFCIYAYIYVVCSTRFWMNFYALDFDRSLQSHIYTFFFFFSSKHPSIRPPYWFCHSFFFIQSEREQASKNCEWIRRILTSSSVGEKLQHENFITTSLCMRIYIHTYCVLVHVLHHPLENNPQFSDARATQYIVKV